MQYERLVDAYLQFERELSASGQEGNLNPSQTEPGEDLLESFEIDLVDIFCEWLYLRGELTQLTATLFHLGRRKQVFAPSATDLWPNVTLLRHGFLGSSPLHPPLAISLRTLENYRQTHRVCPRLSIQAEVRKLCHLHNVSRVRNLM